MGDSISFNEIPIDLLTPGQYVEFDNSKAITGLVAIPKRILLIAPKLASGTATADIPFQLGNVADGIVKLGRGSIGAAMATALYNTTDTIETWVVPIADSGGGAAASGTIVVSGTPTEAGTINLYIAGRQIQVAVSTSDTASTIAAAINAAINADADMPATSSVSTATVTIASRHKGTQGNDIDIRANYYPISERLPAGIALAITPLSGGSGDPSISTALANIGATQYNTMISAFNDASNLALLETELNKRWGPLYQNDGHCHIASRGSVGTLNTYAGSRNNPHITAWGLNAGGSPNPTWEYATVAGTVSAYNLSIDPARPLQTLVLPGIKPASAEKQFTRAERNNLLSYGIATTIVDAGGQVIIERAVTMYTFNSSNIVDPSYRDIETMFTLSYLRYSLRAMISQEFPRFKLRDDGTEIPPSQPIVTPKIITAHILNLFKLWEEAGLVEGYDQFKRDLKVLRNNSDKNRVDVVLPPDIINQFRVFAAQIQFIL